VEYIENNAFLGCNGITSIIIPKSVTLIGDFSLGYIFYNQKIDNFKIYGYLNSNAESYAQENEFVFIALEEVKPQLGDLDFDGNVTIEDLVIIKKISLGLYEEGSIEDFISLLDLNQDGRFSAVDLVLMIQKILNV